MQTVNVNSRVYELGTCHRMIQYRVLSQDVNLYQEQDAAAQLPALPLAGGTGTRQGHGHGAGDCVCERKGDKQLC